MQVEQSLYLQAKENLGLQLKGIALEDRAEQTCQVWLISTAITSRVESNSLEGYKTWQEPACLPILKADDEALAVSVEDILAALQPHTPAGKSYVSCLWGFSSRQSSHHDIPIIPCADPLDDCAPPLLVRDFEDQCCSCFLKPVPFCAAQQPRAWNGSWARLVCFAEREEQNQMLSLEPPLLPGLQLTCYEAQVRCRSLRAYAWICGTFRLKQGSFKCCRGR